MANVVINDANLVAIGNAIRAKNGTTNTYKPREMADAITSLPSGGGEQPGPFVLTDTTSYCFTNEPSKWLLKNYPNQFTTTDLRDIRYMFQGWDENTIPLTLNMKVNSSNILSYCFAESQITEAPAMPNCAPGDIDYMFYGCKYLKDLSTLQMDTWNFYYTTSGYLRGYTFALCMSLRKFPENFFRKWGSALYSTSSSGKRLYEQLFYKDYNLEEVKDLWTTMESNTLTNDTFYSTFERNGCLKHLTFRTLADGSPRTVKWKNQTLRLQAVGYHKEASNGEGILDTVVKYAPERANKMIYNAETYEMFKDDPDAWTGNLYGAESPIPWSLYNIDSAIETINSLPDTSAYGTNTIIFNKNAGSGYGKGIENLSEEVIALASAKGWTITLTT